ncbi:MAG: Phosphorylase superfamily [Chloroflexota bacterium]|nr:Phosphorylase superfamily [Chloroflexota bacterium]
MRVLTTGMGQDAAAGAAVAALDVGVTAVVVAGVAGGCGPTLAVGTVVVATGLCDLGGRPLDAPPVDPAICAAVLAATPPAVAGTVASVDAVVDDPAARARLAASGALAIETEAAGWAAACLRAGVPLLVVRAVLDTPQWPLGDAGVLVRPGATAPSAWRLARLGAHPSAWGMLARLAGVASGVEARAAAAAVAAAAALRDRD